MEMYDPPSAGEILLEGYIKPLNIDPLEFASRLGVDAAYINDVLASRSAINADLALRLSATLGTTAEIWLGLQQQYDLWQAKQKFTAKLQPYNRAVVAQDYEASGYAEELTMQNEEHNVSTIVGIAAGLLFVFGLGIGVYIYSVTSETSPQKTDKTSFITEQ